MYCYIQETISILTVASDEEEKLLHWYGNELTVGIAEAMVATAAALVPAMVASADMELIKRQSVCMNSFKAADSLVFNKPQKEKEKNIQLTVYVFALCIDQWVPREQRLAMASFWSREARLTVDIFPSILLSERSTLKDRLAEG